MAFVCSNERDHRTFVFDNRTHITADLRPQRQAGSGNLFGGVAALLLRRGGSERLLAEAGQPTEGAREMLDQVVEGTAEHRLGVRLVPRIGPTIAGDKSAALVDVAQQEPGHTDGVTQGRCCGVREPNFVAISVPAQSGEPTC